MKHKTADLEGALLDAAVEKIEAARFGMTVGPGHRCDHWHKNWTVAGPIIERERITLQRFHGDPSFIGAWTAYVDTEWGHGSDEVACNWKGTAEGPTALVAAMRAYVASKLGDEVELP